MHPKRKSDLSPARFKQAKCRQCFNIWTIERLTIWNSEPVWDTPARVIRNVKFGTDNGSRSESDIADYAVNVLVRDLLARLDDLGNKTFFCLKIQYGPSIGTQLEEYSLEQQGAVSLLARRQNITSHSTGHK